MVRKSTTISLVLLAFSLDPDLRLGLDLRLDFDHGLDLDLGLDLGPSLHIYHILRYLGMVG